jgi:molybdopterin-synthase adenylyltransferase
LDVELDSSSIKKHLGKEKLDLILDCTDNLKARLAINEYCIKTKTPWIFASALGTKGMVCSLFGKTLQSGWFNKEFGEKKGFHDAKSDGILSTACNAVACIQTTEALKLLLGKKESSELIRIDIWKNKIEIVSI